MDMITVTSSFRRLGRCLVAFTFLIVLICGGCEKKTVEIHSFGQPKDVTEDLYHRLKSGMFEPGTDPFICQIVKIPRVKSFTDLLHTRSEKVPHQIARVSWDRGIFRVYADDMARVVIYMDEETLFSHVQIAVPKELGLSIEFREFIEHPFR